jgi:tRNA pseudouridine38-40 synthase
VRVALGIEYDGAPFCGWQSQPNVPTIQVALEKALGQMAGEFIRVHAAGRTDTGVHATQQVVHFDTDANRPLTAWVRGVNSLLPQSVSVLWAKAVDARFHARFDAMARHYRYILFNHPVRPSLMVGKVGWSHHALDLTAMQSAAALLLGEHDFSSFRASECQAASPVKTLTRLSISRHDNLWYFDFSANAFLHHMVRNIIGTLLHIGKGNESAAWIETLLARRNREIAPPTFMPDGLYLTGVDYPEHFAIPQGARISGGAI